MRPLAAMLIVLALAWSAPWATAQTAGSPVAEKFLGANQLFQSGLELYETDRATARARFEQAAAMYQACVAQGAIENHLLHTNIGNAWLFAGEVGHAIAAYRRALQLKPSHGPAREGLEAARSRVQTAVGTDLPGRVEDIALFWRGHVDRATLATIGVAAHAVFWLALTIHLVTRRLSRWPLTAAAGVLAVYALGSLWLDAGLVESRREGVIVTADAVGRNGPDRSAYEATFATPLSEGVEVTILERRGGWARVRLRDARETWLPVQTIETI